MFFHILKLQREVFWEFCEQAFAAYPLEEIDSIDVNTGQIRTTNALSVVAFGVSIQSLFNILYYYLLLLWIFSKLIKLKIASNILYDRMNWGIWICLRAY